MKKVVVFSFAIWLSACANHASTVTNNQLDPNARHSIGAQPIVQKDEAAGQRAFERWKLDVQKCDANIDTYRDCSSAAKKKFYDALAIYDPDRLEQNRAQDAQADAQWKQLTAPFLQTQKAASECEKKLKAGEFAGHAAEYTRCRYEAAKHLGLDPAQTAFWNRDIEIWKAADEGKISHAEALSEQDDASAKYSALSAQIRAANKMNEASLLSSAQPTPSIPPSTVQQPTPRTCHTVTSGQESTTNCW